MALPPNPTQQQLNDYLNMQTTTPGSPLYNSNVHSGVIQTQPQNPYANMPTAPGYIPSYNSSMATAPGLQTQLNGINLNTQGLDAFRQQALSQGPSAWAKLQNNQIDMGAADQRNKAAQGAAGQTAGNLDALAASGGLSSGARERAIQGGSQSVLGMDQGISRGAEENKLGVATQDESNKINELGALPGMEVQALQPAMQKAGMFQSATQFDTGNDINNINNQNAFNQNTYNNQMTGWGASKTADAMQANRPKK